MAFIKNIPSKVNINNVPFKFQELVLFGNTDSKRVIDSQLLHYLLGIADSQTNTGDYPYYTTVAIRGNEFQKTLFLCINKLWYRAGIIKGHRPDYNLYEACYDICRARYRTAKSLADLRQRWQYGYNWILYTKVEQSI